MINSITTIQEITMQASVTGVYEYLFDTCNECRDIILNRFEEWGKEFEEAHKDYKWDGDYYDEIDNFVEKKFTEIKLANLFPAGIAVGDYLTYEGGLYEVTGFEDDGIAVDELRHGNDKDWIVCTIGFSQAKKIKVLDASDDIMDTTNGHNPELVGKINRAWIERRADFFPILCALYKRDENEIRDSDAFGFSAGIIESYGSIYEYMAKHWDIEAENYLMHIADDTDLKTILNFLHYDA